MSRRMDHDTLNAKRRGKRDHDYAADAEARQAALKKETGQWADRIKAGKKSGSKTARKSGPVKIFTPEERAAFMKALRGEKE